MDIFVAILLVVGLLLIVKGLFILFNRSLEIGALVGIFWIIPGAITFIIGAIIWIIQHVTLDIA